MIDIHTQIRHWQEGDQDDRIAASALIERGHYRQGLFLAHLAVEKLLKANICKKTGDLAPRLHNLVRLCDLAGLNPTSEQTDTLADMNQFNLEGRYPEEMTPPPDQEETLNLMARGRKVLEWLMREL